MRVWDDMVAALAEFNKTRISIVGLLSYPTTNAADAVAQNLTVPSFEEASEFGVPKSVQRQPKSCFADTPVRTGIYERNSPENSLGKRIGAKPIPDQFDEISWGRSLSGNGTPGGRDDLADRVGLPHIPR
jgi:hypothetical protein